jgi:flagellar biosynthetic protein FliP
MKAARWIHLGALIALALGLGLIGAPDAHAAAGPGLSISLGGNDTALTERVLADDRAVDGAEPGAVHPDHDHQLHPDRGGVVAAAYRDRPAAKPAERGADLAIAVSDRLHHVAGFHPGLSGGVEPLLNGQISNQEAFTAAAQPVKAFMLAHTREEDLGLFLNISGEEPETPEATPVYVVAPAFMISELRRAFEIGFLLFIPFLIIDLVVASILMSMGMMMLPPVIISLPFKLIFFVLVDGWTLVIGSLVQSFERMPPGG